jgi:hypothetical protein
MRLTKSLDTAVRDAEIHSAITQPLLRHMWLEIRTERLGGAEPYRKR